MKITYITHACILIEVDGKKIITDPWLVGPSWGGSLWHFPTHKFTPKNLPTPDIIFFSHGHDDHFHEPTIKKFPKKWFKAKIVVPKFKEKWWSEGLETKFKNIKYLKHNEIYKLSNNLKLQIFMNDRGDIDSSLKVMSKDKSCFLQTDNLMTPKEARRISKLGKIDIAFVLPYLTGIYPAYYKMSRKKMMELGKKKKQSSLNYCMSIVKNLKPEYVVPYAVDVASLGKNFYANFIHNNNKVDLYNFFKKNNIEPETMIMNPGNNIEFLSSGLLKKNLTKYDFSSVAFKKFKDKKSNQFKKININEKKLETLKKDKILNSFIKSIQDGLNSIKSINFKVLFLIKFKNQKNMKILLDLKRKQISRNISGNNNPELAIFSEFYKIANLVSGKYPMNFMTFHNGAIVCERETDNLSKNEKTFWDWIYNLSF